MNDFFFIDRTNAVRIFWQNLIIDLMAEKKYNPYCINQDHYKVFKHIIHSLLLQKEIILLDADFSENEIERLTGVTDLAPYEEDVDLTGKNVVQSKDELVQSIKNTSDLWRITLFTSGTTGLPKKITHSYKSITRNVKTGDKHQNDVWGFAYNPTHMAGIQVFFQSLLNGNTLVNLFGSSREQILKSIEDEGITNISATPTFYRLLQPLDKVYPRVRKLTSGGEKFDEKTFSDLKKAFPNARITNIYASTEAGSLLASDGNSFFIKPGMENLIKIENDELLIHNSLMGKSELDFGDWYHTGDLVKLIPTEGTTRFEFISRKNEMINVGGYKVNPEEVEESIRQLDGIKEVRVFAKNNAILGKIVCCEVVRNNSTLDELSIRKHLQIKLQEYKIPRLIKFVENIETTRTGKIKRS